MLLLSSYGYSQFSFCFVCGCMYIILVQKKDDKFAKHCELKLLVNRSMNLWQLSYSVPEKQQNLFNRLFMLSFHVINF